MPSLDGEGMLVYCPATITEDHMADTTQDQQPPPTSRPAPAPACSPDPGPATMNAPSEQSANVVAALLRQADEERRAAVAEATMWRSYANRLGEENERLRMELSAGQTSPFVAKWRADRIVELETLVLQQNLELSFAHAALLDADKKLGLPLGTLNRARRAHAAAHVAAFSKRSS